MALAEAYPNLTHLTVQDYKTAVEQGAVQLPEHLSQRVSFLLPKLSLLARKLWPPNTLAMLRSSSF